MNIYQLDTKKIKEEIKNFQKTAYGKTVLCLAYAPFIIGLLFILLFAVLACYCFPFGMFLPGTVIITLLLFIFGNRYFYRELKEYILLSKKNK